MNSYVLYFNSGGMMTVRADTMEYGPEIIFRISDTQVLGVSRERVWLAYKQDLDINYNPPKPDEETKKESEETKPEEEAAATNDENTETPAT